MNMRTYSSLPFCLTHFSEINVPKSLQFPHEHLTTILVDDFVPTMFQTEEPMAKKSDADAGNGKPTSKMGMVRVTLEKLGGNAKPLAIQAHIKSEYNQEIPTAVISSYKNMILKAAGKVAGRRGRPAKNAAVSAGTGAGAGNLITELATIQGLIARLGASQLHELIDVLAR
jgi:hypothetical protein